MLGGAGIFSKIHIQNMVKIAVFHQLMINTVIFKNSANQRKDTKILFSEWLIQFL
jgi:hypothetical protein